MVDILLSVLIPSIPKRLPNLTRLIERLSAQADPRMEVLVMLDSCSRPLGWKRNTMMAHAQGRYCMHCDDDDLVGVDFFATLLPHLHADHDLIAYDADASLNGAPPFRVRTILGAANEQPRHLDDGRFSDIVRSPWHWCCWRTELARRFAFPNHAGDEDWQWLRQVLPEVKSHVKIDAILYSHFWSSSESTFDGPK